MKSQDIYSTCVPSSINCIGIIVSEFIESLKRRYGDVEDCVLFELKVILNEVLVNAVRHGNKEDENKLVKVEAGISGRGVMFIIVEDEGNGYDYADICSCRKPLREGSDPVDVSECGRGIMIIKSLCDKVKVNARGNKIIIAKSILKA